MKVSEETTFSVRVSGLLFSHISSFDGDLFLIGVPCCILLLFFRALTLSGVAGLAGCGIMSPRLLPSSDLFTRSPLRPTR